MWFFCSVVIGLVGLNFVFFGFEVYIFMMSKEIVVLFEVCWFYEIGVNYVSFDYLMDMVGYVFDKVLMVMLEMVDYNNKVILKMVYLDGYGEFKIMFDVVVLCVK